MNIGIIVDGNEEIGLGHIIRCRTIAKYLNLKSVNVTFITSYKVDKVLLENFNHISVKKEYWDDVSNNHRYYKNLLKNFDSVLLDLTENKYSNFLFLHELPIFIVSLTLFKFKDKNYFGEVSFFPSIVKSQYKINKTQIFTGPQYFIIDGKITGLFKDANTYNTVPNLLISMGGADPMNITEKVIRSTDFFDFKFNAIVIAGKVNRNKEKIKLMADKRSNFTYYEFVEDIETVYSSVDFAIINGGNTRYELTYLQIPYACISIHEVQDKINRDVTNLYGGLNLGIYSNISNTFIANEINKVVKSSEKMSVIREKMKFFNGGKGYVPIGDTLINKRYIDEGND